MLTRLPLPLQRESLRFPIVAFIFPPELDFVRDEALLFDQTPIDFGAVLQCRRKLTDQLPQPNAALPRHL